MANRQPDYKAPNINNAFNPKYPTTNDLKIRAKKRIPSFAFDYLVGGCSDEVGLRRNFTDMQSVQLKQNFVRPFIKDPILKSKFCGLEFDAPIGVAPVGLQGLMWPKAPILLCKMAKKYNIPYILSTLSTHSLEEVAEASEGHALFQLYNPEDPDIRKDLLKRVKDAQYRALIITADISSFGYRPRDIKNGLSLPPKINFSNVVQAALHPEWSLRTLADGFLPRFRTLTPYLQGANMSQLSEFMNDKMMGGCSQEQLKYIRDVWDGPLILKGVLTEHDMDFCIKLGLDGVVVSNHGARQMDAGETSIAVLPKLVKKYKGKIDISFDSGIQSGTDIACALASGATFTFAGRPFVYGTAALGNAGPDHTITMLKNQLKQAMQQIGCPHVADLPDFLV